MNRLKAGVVLSVPSAETAQAIPPGEARQTITAQSADFGAYRQRLAASTQGTAPVAEPNKRQSAGRVTASVDDKKQPANASPDTLKLSKGGATPPSAPGSAEDRLVERAPAPGRGRSRRRAEQERRRSQAAAGQGVAAVDDDRDRARARRRPRRRRSPGVDAGRAGTDPGAGDRRGAAAAAGAGAVAPPVALPPPVDRRGLDAVDERLGPRRHGAGRRGRRRRAALGAGRRATRPAPSRQAAPGRRARRPSRASSTRSRAATRSISASAFSACSLVGYGAYRYTQRSKKDSGETSFLESRLQPDSFFGASGGQRIDTRDAGRQLVVDDLLAVAARRDRRRRSGRRGRRLPRLRPRPAGRGDPQGGDAQQPRAPRDPHQAARGLRQAARHQGLRAARDAALRADARRGRRLGQGAGARRADRPRQPDVPRRRRAGAAARRRRGRRAARREHAAAVDHSGAVALHLVDAASRRTATAPSTASTSTSTTPTSARRRGRRRST